MPKCGKKSVKKTTADGRKNCKFICLTCATEHDWEDNDCFCGEAMQQCDFCDQKISRQLIQQHAKMHFTDVENQFNNQKKINNDAVICCEACDKKIKNLNAYEEHVASHFKCATQACTGCPKLFLRGKNWDQAFDQHCNGTRVHLIRNVKTRGTPARHSDPPARAKAKCVNTSETSSCSDNDSLPDTSSCSDNDSLPDTTSENPIVHDTHRVSIFEQLFLDITFIH